MAIITISRGSYFLGKSVAEKVAQKLGYDIISREVLLDASAEFNVPEIKLVKAIHDAPGILGRYRQTKQSYITYIRSALTERAVRDNIVYHGLAGHLLLKEIPHVLKVRITSSLENRVASEMKREGVSEQKARKSILEDDKQRRKWTKSLYGEDPWDIGLYDLVIRVEKLSVDHAVNLICETAESDGFKTTEKSLQKAKDLAMACWVKASFIKEFPNIWVTCEYGNLLIYTKEKDYGAFKASKKLAEIREDIIGLNSLEIHTGSMVPSDAV